MKNGFGAKSSRGVPSSAGKQSAAARKQSIVFFGTGPVAAKSLQEISDEFAIELVVTKPKPAKHKYNAPVEDFAHGRKLKVLLVNDKNDIANKLKQENIKSPVGLVIDFGIIIPTNAVKIFPEGIINSHFSLLPRWRGADPITYAILNGDKETGVSLMKITDKLDEGPLIAQKSIVLDNKVNSTELTPQLIKLSNEMLKEFLPKYINGEISPIPQTADNITYSRKLTKQDGVVDWSKPAQQIEREVRAYAGWPKSRAKIGGIECIILDTEVVNSQNKPGMLKIDNNQLIIHCKKDALLINKIQPAGKKPMTASEFIRGYSRKLAG